MTPPEPRGGEGRDPVYTAAYDSIRKGAPGLSDATCQVIARSINMKVALFPPVVGWRPIDQDTPRDGRLMWLGRPYSLRVGFWATGEKYEHKGTVGGGWRDFNEGRDLAFEPTHWQPVPDAPPALLAAPLTTDETQP